MHKLMKKCLIIALCIGLALGLTSCGKSSNAWDDDFPSTGTESPLPEEDPKDEENPEEDPPTDEEDDEDEDPLPDPPTSSGVWTPPTTMDP